MSSWFRKQNIAAQVSCSSTGGMRDSIGSRLALALFRTGTCPAPAATKKNCPSKSALVANHRKAASMTSATYQETKKRKMRNTGTRTLDREESAKFMLWKEF